MVVDGNKFGVFCDVATTIYCFMLRSDERICYETSYILQRIRARKAELLRI